MDPITLLILAGIGIAAAMLARKRSRPRAPQPVSVIIDGDSIVFGLYLQHNIAARLREWRPAWAVDDRGVVGLLLHTLLAGYREPYAGAPPEHYPRGQQPPYSQVARSSRIVVIEAGGNDTLFLPDVAAWEADMRSAIEIVRAEGRVPVLTGIVDFDVAGDLTPEIKARRDRCNAITHQLAAINAEAVVGAPIRPEELP